MIRKTRIAVLALACLVAACSFGADDDDTLSETELGNVDVLEGTINDDMIDVDRAATPEGEAPPPEADDDAEADSAESDEDEEVSEPAEAVVDNNDVE